MFSIPACIWLRRSGGDRPPFQLSRKRNVFASLSRVDHVVLSDDASRAYAVQRDINSLFKRHTDVNVAQAVGTPLKQWPVVA